MRLKFFLLTAFLIVLPRVAMSFNDCVNISVGAEALYWKPCVEPFHYGEFADPNVLDRQITLELDYQTGFRLFANVADLCYCKFLDLEWAHFRGSSKETSTDGTVPIVLTHFNFTQSIERGASNSIQARQDTSYDKVSVKGGYRFCGNDCSWLYGYIGGRWIRIDVQMESKADLIEPVTSDISQVSWCTEFNAGGFEVGFGANANLWCGFGAAIRAGGIAAMGCRDHEFFQLEEIGGILARKNRFSSSICTGGFEFRGGMNYTYCCKCWWLRAEVGYELDYYFKTLLQEQPTIDSPNILAENFGIGGPYFGLTIGF